MPKFKRKSKGFTLIELVVVIGLLSIIAVIIILNLNKNLKNQNEKDYNAFVEKIKSATNVYMAANKEAEIYAKTDDYNVISIDRLEESGLISKDKIIDPETNLKLSELDDDDPKRFVKIYNDDETNGENSGATLIEYPAKGINEFYRYIRYNMNDFGVCNPNPATVLVGEKMELCNPKDENAQFQGWYTDEKKTVAVKLESDGKYKPLESISFYAKWKKTKPATINNFTVTSTNNNYNDQKVNVRLNITDVYNGPVEFCITTTNNINSCTNWKNYELGKEYSEVLDLTTLNSSNTTGSGNNLTIYVFTKNSAYEEDPSIYSSKKVTYEIYKYCSQYTVISESLGACSKACGSGSQKKTSQIKDKYFASATCNALVTNQTCNTMDCCSSIRTEYGNYGSCSASCGGGTQYRTVTEYSTYDNSVCNSYQESNTCNTGSCCGEDRLECGTYLGQVTYRFVNNCNTNPSWNYDTAGYCSGGGSSGGGATNCNGGTLNYGGGFSCNPYCYQTASLDCRWINGYDYECQCPCCGWQEAVGYCINYYCPS